MSLFVQVESSLTSTIASFLNARKDGAIVFGAYGFPVKRVVGVNLAEEVERDVRGGGGGGGEATVADLKLDFQQLMLMKLNRYFGDAQRNALELVEIVLESVVRSGEGVDTGDQNVNSSLAVVENTFVIQIRVEGSKCGQIVDSPAKGRHR